jgi:hypothetical protein
MIFLQAIESNLIKGKLPEYPGGTVTYTVLSNQAPNTSFPIVTYQALPALPQPAFRYDELPTIVTPAMFRATTSRVAGLGLGSAQMSDDFDEPLPGELGFGEA